jgi:uncharacterized protein YgiM (DUF1202 family)
MTKKQITTLFIALTVSLFALMATLLNYANNVNKNAVNDQQARTEIKQLNETLKEKDKKIKEINGKLKIKDQEIKSINDKLTALDSIVQELQAAPKNEPQPQTEETPAAPEVVEQNGYLLVNATYLRFRTGPSLQHDVQRYLEKGEQLQTLNEQQEVDGYTWTKVKDGSGQEGWIATIYTNYQQ